jgi:hypothetical protein
LRIVLFPALKPRQRNVALGDMSDSMIHLSGALSSAAAKASPSR